MECIINNKIAIMVYDVGQATFFLKQAEVFYKDLEVEWKGDVCKVYKSIKSLIKGQKWMMWMIFHPFYQTEEDWLNEHV